MLKLKIYFLRGFFNSFKDGVKLLNIKKLKKMEIVGG